MGTGDRGRGLQTVARSCPQGHRSSVPPATEGLPCSAGGATAWAPPAPRAEAAPPAGSPAQDPTMLQAHGPAPGAPLGTPSERTQGPGHPQSSPRPRPAEAAGMSMPLGSQRSPQDQHGATERRLTAQRLAPYQKALAGQPGSRATGQQWGQAPGGASRGDFLMPLSLGAPPRPTRECHLGAGATWVTAGARCCPQGPALS